MDTLSPQSAKRDAVEHRRRSADEGRALVAAWQSSGDLGSDWYHGVLMGLNRLCFVNENLIAIWAVKRPF